MFLNPAELDHMLAGPIEGSVSSGSIYEWLGIDQWQKFSDDVVTGLLQVRFVVTMSCHNATDFIVSMQILSFSTNMCSLRSTQNSLAGVRRKVPPLSLLHQRPGDQNDVVIVVAAQRQKRRQQRKWKLACGP